MTISPPGTMPTPTVTRANHWWAILLKRVTIRRIEIPLELRLILITTTIVLTLVAAGAEIASVVSAQHALPASLQANAPATPDVSDLWSPDGVCRPASTAPHMFSAQELTVARTAGIRQIRPDAFRACLINGLIVPTPPVGTPIAHGQVILVSTSQEWLWAYQDGRLVFANPVATGMPHLRTPHGVYHIQFKRANTTFYSPWPRSSPFYYTPEHINYALNFRAGGFYIHDLPSRQMFGPGAQNPHMTPDGQRETGSHGCVNMTTSAAAWLYSWAQVGATVEIVA